MIASVASRATRGPAFTVQIGAALTGLTVASFVLLQVSHDTFSDTAPSDGTSAGHVTITDDSWGGATFESHGMVPGDTDQTCITVAYEGRGDADVKLYGTTTSIENDLGEYLTLTIEDVDLGGGTCAEASLNDTVFDAPLAVDTGAFAVDHTTWDNGVELNDAKRPWTRGEDHTYRLSLELLDDNDAQGLDTTATFTWEAQNQ